MSQYPLDHGPSRDNSVPRRDRKVQAEVDVALRSSFEIHSKSSLYAAQEDLALNPVSGSSLHRRLTPDLYAGSDDADDEVMQDHDSAIDDVVSNGTWRTSSYLGPKHSAGNDLAVDAIRDVPSSLKQNVSDFGRAISDRFQKESAARPFAMAIGAAGAGYLIARMMQSGKNS